MFIGYNAVLAGLFERATLLGIGVSLLARVAELGRVCGIREGCLDTFLLLGELLGQPLVCTLEGG